MPTKSIYPDINVPDINIWELLFERTDRPFPDNQVIYRDAVTKRSYTYAQVKKFSIAFGKTLKSVYQWKESDALAIFSPNCIDTSAIVFGALWAGGVVTSANPAYTVDELALQLRDSKSRVLVTQASLLPTACAAAKMVGIPDECIILIGDESDKTEKFPHFLDLILTHDSGWGLHRTPTKGNKDLAFLVYSSGTTGLPKGVMLSHRNIVSNILMIHAADGKNLSWDGGDRMLAFVPFYHIYGLVCCLHLALYNGIELVVMQKFNLEQFCSHIQEYKITFSTVVPPVLLLLAKDPIVTKYDFSTIRMFSSGAAPLTKELVESVYNRIKTPVRQGYGLSETSPGTHTQVWDKWNESIGSVGPLLPNMVAKYMSPTGQEVPAGQVGELWLKGPNVFMGYFNNSAATAHCMTEDGYFKTGDVGYQDEKGDFYITDRVKELIKYKGFQVAPAELEGVLISHEEIKDVAVIGVYDKEQATELPRAYVVLQKGVEPTPAAGRRIIEWISERVASHKKLRGGVRFIDEVPKSAAGKILRRVLVEKAKKEQEGPRGKL